MSDDWRERMERAANEAAEETDRELADELAALKRATTADLEHLKPDITDETAYNKLIEAVRESTRRNESIAQLTTRIRTLGQGVVKVAKEAAKLLV